jgi:hypothetical protein
MNRAGKVRRYGMDNEDVKNLIKTNLIAIDVFKEELIRLKGDVAELKRTGVKPKKKKLPNTIGLKVCDGGKKLGPEPDFKN